MIELEPSYDPKQYEKKWYRHSLENKFFSAPVYSQKVPYTILMPPPNVTSQLHMGHRPGLFHSGSFRALETNEGFSTPVGSQVTDHAGIATQMMVEKDLEKEGSSRQQMGREKFFQRLVDWKEKYGGIILDQFKTMGFSCDWDRLAYTMDPKLSDAVRYVFVELYKEGLIYRGERLVNWDTVLQTAISDDEVGKQRNPGHTLLLPLSYRRHP